MKVRELIERLQDLDPNDDVYIHLQVHDPTMQTVEENTVDIEMKVSYEICPNISRTEQQ